MIGKVTEKRNQNQNIAVRFLLGVVLLVSTPLLQATTYTTGINPGEWKTVSSVFECRLEQPVPLFGDIVFRTRAGEASGAYLRSKTARFAAGDAAMVARTPVWRPKQESINLGAVAMKQGTRPLWLGSKRAELMLSHLSDGREIEISNPAWYRESPEARLAVTTIGFRHEYSNYLSCLAGLLPANFDQLRRTAVYFRNGDAEYLNATARSHLDKIVTLVKHDPKIQKFYIDGHTDTVGDRADNLELSKLRAELVSQYLISKGIPAEQLVIRWHGERYPASSNGSWDGRSKNRRVTVRLEKLEASQPNTKPANSMAGVDPPK